LTFSRKIKDEVSRIKSSCESCVVFELFGIWLALKKNKGEMVKLYTDSAPFARKLLALLKKTENSKYQLKCKKNTRRNKGYLYVVSFFPNFLGNVLSMKPFENILPDKMDFSLKNRNLCCIKSVIRGVFLVGGALNDPQKSYFAQMLYHDRSSMELGEKILKEFGLEPKVLHRRNRFVIYLKDSEQIVDLLNIIGGTHALMEVENIRILKEVKNHVNRIVNCETANLEKVVKASVQQIQYITMIQNTMGFSHLPKKLRDLAEARMKHKEASLKELGEFLNPPVGKSGVNHRLKKLEKIARELIEGKGISDASTDH
jgi:cell division protein WhiA